MATLSRTALKSNAASPVATKIHQGAFRNRFFKSFLMLTFSSVSICVTRSFVQLKQSKNSTTQIIPMVPTPITQPMGEVLTVDSAALDN